MEWSFKRVIEVGIDTNVNLVCLCLLTGDNKINLEMLEFWRVNCQLLMFCWLLPLQIKLDPAVMKVDITTCCQN